MVIQQDDEIRIKIVGTRVDATDIVSVKMTFYVLIFKCDGNKMHILYI